MPKKQPIIALAPIEYYNECKGHNVAKIKTYIGLAKKAKADIVCFPESCIKKHGKLALTDKFIKAIREECQKHAIWCIITEDIAVGKKTYNMSILIDRQGKIQGDYKKINLYGDRVTPGNKIKVFQTDFAKIGIAICWDLTYPDLFVKMWKKGAEIIFCPAMWNYDQISHDREHKKREIQLLRAMTLARAHENIFYVALCNPLLKDKTQISYSAIANPHRIVKELIDKEGIMTAQIDLKKLKQFRKFYLK